MPGPDSFYTPIHLANRLMSHVTEDSIQTAIDFCVGNGNLLKAVHNRFNKAKLFGTDISDDIIEEMATQHTDWTLGVCDFKDNTSIKQLSFLKNKHFDLIILNPPFTCKGSNVEHIKFRGRPYKVSTAMMFIMKSLKYLSPSGSLYAILPISCVYSQKDKAAWQYLQTNYNACILEELKHVHFGHRCSPNIALVYLGHQEKYRRETCFTNLFSHLSVERIIRGSISMHNISYSNSSDALKLIHTTNIQNGKLVNLKQIIAKKKSIIDGYGVVIPRVCNPNPKKIALLDGKHSYVISDCIIVLKTSTMDDAKQVRCHILQHWHTFTNLYKGTGAQYTTIEKVKTLFGKYNQM